jgi:hypothetical protein
MEGPNGGVFRLEELDSLHARGVVNDSTKFTGVRYRYLIKARSREEASRVATTKWPRKAPQAVYKMLLSQVGMRH